VQKDMPLYALQELGGGKVRRMVRRYVHLTAEHVAPYAERLGEAQVRRSEFMAQIRHSARNEKAPASLQALELVARPAGFEPTTPPGS